MAKQRSKYLVSGLIGLTKYRHDPKHSNIFLKFEDVETLAVSKAQAKANVLARLTIEKGLKPRDTFMIEWLVKGPFFNEHQKIAHAPLLVPNPKGGSTVESNHPAPRDQGRKATRRAEQVRFLFPGS